VHLCRVSEVYSSYSSLAQVDVKMLDDFSNCSKDVQLKVFLQQVGRGVDNEDNVSLPTTLHWAWLWNKFDVVFTVKPSNNYTMCKSIPPNNQ